MLLPLQVHGSTHVGLIHEINEDSHAVVPTEEDGVLLLVCDGMGGMGQGDKASALAVRLLTEELRVGGGYPPQRMRTAIRKADIALRGELCDGTDGMPGSTAVMAYVLDGAAHVAWVGDSRAYLIRGGAVLERTADHKLINELMATGQLSEEEARDSHLSHIVTRALGGRSPAERPVTGATMGHPWKLKHGDTLVLCSDGLCDLVDDEEMARLVTGLTPDEATEALIRVALERGGHDNITCIVAHWEGQDYVEDEAATPLMGAREAGPEELDAPAYREVVDTLDERQGAERATEEIGVDELPWKRPEGDPEAYAATPLAPELRLPPAEVPSPDAPPAAEAPSPAADVAETPDASPATGEPPTPESAGEGPSPTVTPPFDPETRGRAWMVVLAAVLVLLLAAALIALTA